MERMVKKLRSEPEHLVSLALALGGFLYIMRQSGYGLFLVVASLCYALSALGIVLITGWAGQMSLAQAAGPESAHSSWASSRERIP